MPLQGASTSQARLTRYESLAVFRRLSGSRVGAQLKPSNSSADQATDAGRRQQQENLTATENCRKMYSLCWFFSSTEESI